MRKALLVLGLLVLIAGMLFAKGPPEKVERDKIVVMKFENGDPNYPVTGAQPVIEYAEDLLGIDVEFRLFPHAERSTAINLMIAGGGEMPDLFPAFGFSLSGTTYVGLEERGIIKAWSDEMEAGNMPLTVEKFKQPYMATALKQMTDLDNGKIYTLPRMQRSPLMIWTDYVRGDWLRKLGLEVPTTVDEFRDVLRAFKTQDPNGNGKADEIPWQNFYEGVTWAKMFTRMFGLPTPDYSLSTVDTLYWATVDKEEVVFSPIHERFKAMVEFIHSLWMEGLINPDQFNMTSPKFTASLGDNTLGSQNMWPSAIPGQTELLRVVEPEGEWLPYPYPIDPRFMTQEDRVFAFIGPCHTRWLLSKKGKNMEAAVRWMDYVFGSEEYVFIAEYGIEGVHYELDDNGKPFYIGEAAELPTDTRIWYLGSMVGMLAHESRNIGVRNEIETSPKYELFKNYMEQIDPYVKPATLWLLNAEQQEKVVAVTQKVRTFVDENFTKFVIGKRPLSEWDDYVQEVIDIAGPEIEAARQMYQDYFDQHVKAYY